MEIRIIDGFVWFIVTRQAKEVFESNLFELYAVYDDGSESFIETIDYLEECLENKIKIGIEGGFINN